MFAPMTRKDSIKKTNVLMVSGQFTYDRKEKVMKRLIVLFVVIALFVVMEATSVFAVDIDNFSEGCSLYVVAAEALKTAELDTPQYESSMKDLATAQEIFRQEVTTINTQEELDKTREYAKSMKELGEFMVEPFDFLLKLLDEREKFMAVHPS